MTHDVLNGDGHDGRQFPDGRGVVFLHSHEAAQDVVSIARPRVNVGVLEPGRDVTPFSSRKQDRNEAEILAPILDELIL